MRQHITIGVTKLKRHAQQRLNRTLEERQRLLHLATKGRFSEVEIEAETQRLAYEENMARTDLARALVIEQSHTTLLNEAADDITAIQAWNSLDTLQLRQVLRRLIQAVYLNDEWQVTHIDWQPLWEMLWFGPQVTA